MSSTSLSLATFALCSCAEVTIKTFFSISSIGRPSFVDKNSLRFSVSLFALVISFVMRMVRGLILLYLF
ncbi:hypothetical protein [Thermodesulfovibrio yellowstonii]|uniref:hypothetical protein n=1 Tax=Thermodesulfovibrio yellowstonii TaxID=28262 RepID=UPI002493C8B8|nr:hypothetical protein [Thermodesulfovibrio islandicus]